MLRKITVPAFAILFAMFLLAGMFGFTGAAADALGFHAQATAQALPAAAAAGLDDRPVVMPLEKTTVAHAPKLSIAGVNAAQPDFSAESHYFFRSDRFQPFVYAQNVSGTLTLAYDVVGPRGYAKSGTVDVSGTELKALYDKEVVPGIGLGDTLSIKITLNGIVVVDYTYGFPNGGPVFAHFVRVDDCHYQVEGHVDPVGDVSEEGTPIVSFNIITDDWISDPFALLSNLAHGKVRVDFWRDASRTKSRGWIEQDLTNGCIPTATSTATPVTPTETTTPTSTPVITETTTPTSTPVTATPTATSTPVITETTTPTSTPVTATPTSTPTVGCPPEKQHDNGLCYSEADFGGQPTVDCFNRTATFWLKNAAFGRAGIYINDNGTLKELIRVLKDRKDLTQQEIADGTPYLVNGDTVVVPHEWAGGRYAEAELYFQVRYIENVSSERKEGRLTLPAVDFSKLNCAPVQSTLDCSGAYVSIDWVPADENLMRGGWIVIRRLSDGAQHYVFIGFGGVEYRMVTDKWGNTRKIGFWKFYVQNWWDSPSLDNYMIESGYIAGHHIGAQPATKTGGCTVMTTTKIETTPITGCFRGPDGSINRKTFEDGKIPAGYTQTTCEVKPRKIPNTAGEIAENELWKYLLAEYAKEALPALLLGSHLALIFALTLIAYAKTSNRNTMR